MKTLTYDIGDLFGYMDFLGDLCCLVFNQQLNAYIPHNKEWMKDRLFQHLKMQVRQ